MGIVKSSLTLVLAIALSVSGFFAGKKVGIAAEKVAVPKVLVLDIKTGEFTPLVIDKDSAIFVESPNGIEPGILAGHSKKGNQILILPPSLIQESEPSPTPPAPTAQPDDGSLHKA